MPRHKALQCPLNWTMSDQIGADRIAVLAALQITQELMAAKNSDGVSIVELRRRLRDLNALADDMLAPQEKLFP